MRAISGERKILFRPDRKSPEGPAKIQDDTSGTLVPNFSIYEQGFREHQPRQPLFVVNNKGEEEVEGLVC